MDHSVFLAWFGFKPVAAFDREFLAQLLEDAGLAVVT